MGKSTKGVWEEEKMFEDRQWKEATMKRKRKSYSRSSFIEKGNVFSQVVPVKKEIIKQSGNLLKTLLL